MSEDGAQEDGSEAAFVADMSEGWGEEETIDGADDEAGDDNEYVDSSDDEYAAAHVHADEGEDESSCRNEGEDGLWVRVQVRFQLRLRRRLWTRF